MRKEAVMIITNTKGNVQSNHNLVLRWGSRRAQPPPGPSTLRKPPSNSGVGGAGHHPSGPRRETQTSSTSRDVLRVARAFCHFMKLSAEPCLNQLICSSLKVWLAVTSSGCAVGVGDLEREGHSRSWKFSRPVIDTLALPDILS